MKKFFVFAVVAIVALTAQANTTNDTIKANKITYQPVVNGKIVTINKGDSVLISGVDSVVVVAEDTTKNSDLVKVYSDGKVKITDWLQKGYTTVPDPADTTGQKTIIIAVGGDENGPDGLPIGKGWIALMVVCGCAGIFGGGRWLKFW